MSKFQRGFLSPVGVTFLFATIIVAWVLVRSEGDALALVRIGTQFSEGIENGTEGYDGQFVYFIARDPNPESVAELLDAPAYRYQRILLPIIARLLSFGNETLLPWALIFIGVISHAGGTWAVVTLLEKWGINRWYGLVYGLWVGFVLAVRLDLPEPLAYGLVAFALLCNESGTKKLAWVFYGLAVFAKEVTFLFMAAQLVVDLLSGKRRDALGLAMVAGVPFLVFQLWLWKIFGQAGLGSGGAMATPFELIPFMGLLRVAKYSNLYFWALVAVYTPFVIFPALWGLISSIKKWLVHKDVSVVIFGLMINTAIIPFIPFSTFREPGGMLRFTSGLVLAVLLYSARYNIKRGLNYSVFWIVLNAILLNEIL